MSDDLIIDGGVLEGGGQILRNASSLSCILKKAITIENIRAGRDKPGLRPQHLSGLQLLRDLSNGQFAGGDLGSTKIFLAPKIIEGGQHMIDTKTAGSVCLLIQSALPCLLLANKKSRLVLRGGTNAAMAPPIDYFIHVLKPMLEKIGIHFDCQLVKRGFYPKGGGEVILACDPVKNIQPIVLMERGSLINIFGLAYVAGVLPLKMAHQMREKAESILKQKYPHISIRIDVIKENNCLGNGSGIILVAETDQGIKFGASALGERGKDTNVVASDAANELLEALQSKSCVDKYMQDQLIIFMALSNGQSMMRTTKLTLHTQTAIHVAQLITKVKFDVNEISDDEYIITCQGINYNNNNL